MTKPLMATLVTATNAGDVNNFLVEVKTPLAWWGPDELHHSVVERFDQSSLAMVLVPAIGDSSSLNTPGVVSALTSRYEASGGPQPALTVVVRVEAVQAAGGFDPRFPGLGLADLAQRLIDRGWSVQGLGPSAEDQTGLAPFGEALYQGLTARQRFATDALWYRLHRPGREKRRRGDRDTTWFRRAAITASSLVAAAPTSSTERSRQARQVGRDAAGHWVTRSPEETQMATGHRADWRFLLPDAARHLMVVIDDRDGTPERWRWLETDGWIETCAVFADPTALSNRSFDRSADVVVLTGSVTTRLDPESDLDTVLAHASSEASVVLELPRSLSAVATGRTGFTDRLAAAGFSTIATYLVTPNLERAKRLIPIDGGEALTWMAAEIGPSWVPTSVKGQGTRLASGLVRSRLGSPVGDRLVVATRGVAPNTYLDGELDENNELLLFTSGHDEGSRAVVLPIATGAGQPRGAIKISARPAYNPNVTAEVERITNLQTMLDTAKTPTGAVALPRIEATFTVGNLAASREALAGRWTAAALGYREPDRREQILNGVGLALTQFTTATTDRRQPWSRELFTTLLADPYRHYGELVGSSPLLDALIGDLETRSQQMEGSELVLAQRHYDAGPWNVMVGEGPDDPWTFIDWELGPPRTDDPAPGGADHLYFAKYWLHIAMATRSLDDELDAFEFLARPEEAGGNDPRRSAKAMIESAFGAMEIDTGLIPLILVHTWLETALYTVARRRERAIEAGSAKPYLETIARYRIQLLNTWSPKG